MQICLWTQPTTVCVCNVVDADVPVDTAGRLFSSSVGVGVLADSVQQTADTRLSVCRDLLIFVSLTQRLSEQVHSPFTVRPVLGLSLSTLLLCPGRLAEYCDDRVCLFFLSVFLSLVHSQSLSVLCLEHTLTPV